MDPTMEKCRIQDRAKLLVSTDMSPPTDRVASAVEVEQKPFHLPSKLWEKVFALVDLEFLFDPFVFRVDRKDFDRFELVARNDVMLAGIKTVRFQLGTMSIEHMCPQLGYCYLQEYNSARIPSPRFGCYTDEQLESRKNHATQEYAAWNSHWHEAEQDFRNVKAMKTMLAKLKSLRRIDVTCAGAPFSSELLLAAWSRGSYHGNFKRATKEFLTLLLALRDTCSQVKHLTHDQIPVTFFAMKESLLCNLTSSLQHLTDLRLTFAATCYPHTRFWNGLGCFLRSIPGLQMLRFGFAPLETGSTNGGIWLYAEDDLPHWYVPLWKMLEEHTWKNLRKLQLDSLMLCEVGLHQLLVRHAPALKYLNLFNLALWSGSFEGLLSSIRSELSLKKFRLWGVCRGFHTPYEGWRLQPLVDLDDEIWSTQLKAYATNMNTRLTKVWKQANCLSSLDVNRRLDLFMTPGLSWPWPLRPSDGLDQLMRPRFFRGHHSDQCQQDCVLTTAKINQAWEEGMKESFDGWVDNFAPDTQGIGEEEIVEFYIDDGFDEEGYDQDGLNMDGSHFMDVYEDWQGAKDPISRYAAERVMRDSIISQIPRYSR